MTALALRDVVGSWGRPPDEAAKVAAALAIVALLLALAGRGRSLLGLGPEPMPRRLFLWLTAFVAALLSVLYIAIYLRGGPRIIDATTYFLQGRALSHGDFAWPILEPTASFRGRFLLYRELPGGGGVMGGIFPPGYPLLLALGFAMGAPTVIGPVIAAALVVATYRLARTLARAHLSPESELVEPIARSAALISVACAALRYHTADTMAHGATALGIVLALDAALHHKTLVAGLLVGAVVATRPVSALPIGVVVLWLSLRRQPALAPATPARKVLGRLVLGVLPGVLVLVIAQHAVTGAWLASSQRMYYATSDGPPGCFGVGKGAGCIFEHGEFVKARLGGGFGVVAAAGSTLRRLRMHLLDVANFEPLALVLLVPLARARATATAKATRSRAVTAALVLIGLQLLAYAPFYFDGNYPGGGARLFADVLPVEHALLAIAVAQLATGARFVRGAFLLLATMLGGFSVHASFEHIKLAERDGGRPMFEPDVLAHANVTSGLVFVDTDHGFALGYDPEANVKHGVVVARLRNDDRDRLLYDRLGHPPTYLYKFERPPAPNPSAPPPTATAVVVPWAPAALGDTLHFDAEAEWPPLAQRGGFAAPVFTETCAAGSRALLVLPTPLAGHASATISVPVPQSGRYAIHVRVVQGAKLPFTATRAATLPAGSLTVGTTRWDWVDVDGGACADLPLHEATLSAPNAHFVIEATGGAVAVDRISIKRLP